MLDPKALKGYISNGNLELAIEQISIWFEKNSKRFANNNRFKDLFNEFIHITGLYNNSQNKLPSIRSLSDIILIRAKGQMGIISLIDSLVLFYEQENEWSNKLIKIVLNISQSKISLFKSKINIFSEKILIEKKEFEIFKNDINGGISVILKISYENAFQILNYYRGGVLQEFGITNAELSGEEKNLIEILDHQYTGNIRIYKMRAFAGSGYGGFPDEYDEYNEFQTFSIPGVKGPAIAFPISGNSLYPFLKDHDLVISMEVFNLSDIRDHELYVVRSNGNVWVRYVICIFNERRRLVKLKMISPNSFDHETFEEEVNETTRLYKAIKIISSF